MAPFTTPYQLKLHSTFSITRFDSSNEETNKDSIPVIDMCNWDDPSVAKAVCDAARKWGFFQIVNHGAILLKPIKLSEWKDYLSLFFVSNDEAASLWPPICGNRALEYMKSSESVVKKLLEILMNGLNVKEIDETRESILMGPSDIIGPLAEVIESGEKPVYKHVLYSDYVKHFFRKAHDGKATIEFAKA
ncbi:feruloyl CoA ortho-hydroxylase 1-like protein [Tanacetum coccineum]